MGQRKGGLSSHATLRTTTVINHVVAGAIIIMVVGGLLEIDAHAIVTALCSAAFLTVLLLHSRFHCYGPIDKRWGMRIIVLGLSVGAATFISHTAVYHKPQMALYPALLAACQGLVLIAALVIAWFIAKANPRTH